MRTTESTDQLTRSDMVTIRKAFREGWSGTAEKRAATIVRLKAVIDDQRSSERDRSKARETLLLVVGE